MPTEVEHGTFYGLEKTDLDTIKGYLKSAVQGAAKLQSKSGGLVLSGTNLNGQFFSWSPPSGVASTDELRLALIDAYHQIDVTDGNATDPGPVTDRAAARFN